MKLIIFLSITTLLLITYSFSTAKKPNSKAALKTLENFCVYVPSGNTVIDKDTVSVQGFYMSQEITNLQYAEFLAHLKRNGESDKLKAASIDTAKWTTAFKQAFLDPMGRHYHSHPAYHKYPVVNVSKEGAELFCDWLTNVYDSISGGELRLKFRVPLRTEYIRAARGDDHNRVYTWKGTTIYKRDGKQVFFGQMQANCIRNGAECITRNKETGQLEYIHAEYPEVDFHSDGAFLTAPSESYWPNDYGLYNINGNVAEMISDGDFAVGGAWNSPGYDIRNESITDFTEPHPTVGFRVVASYIE